MWSRQKAQWLPRRGCSEVGKLRWRAFAASLLGFNSLIMSSRTITLFADASQSSRGSSPVIASILAHLAAIGVLYAGFNHMTRIDTRIVHQRYSVRMMDLQLSDPPTPRPPRGGISYPGKQVMAQAIQTSGSLASAFAFQALKPSIRLTLIQPDVPPNVLLPKDARIPAVLLWSPQSVRVQTIVPPSPHEMTLALTTPSIIPPNRELRIADVAISATSFETKTVALPPSSTSPLVVRGPEPTAVPETSSHSNGQATPAQVIVLSDFQVEAGTIALPQVNQVSQSSDKGLSRQPALSEAGNGTHENNNRTNSTNPEGANHSGEGGQKTTGEKSVSGNSGSLEARNSSGDKGTASGSGKTSAATRSSAQGAAGAGQKEQHESGAEDDPSISQINFPKDGKFGMVVVGASLEEQYPETAGLLGGRVAYTVYLHVGLAKSWILQYCLPLDVEAASAGTASRPEAPWPYHMVRPRLTPDDFNSDAIMIRAVVNVAGRFEKLSVVFPTDFRQSLFVLKTLQQWQFRPAIQNGKNVAVDIVIIIPEQPE
jgi:hypothetical protein